MAFSGIREFSDFWKVDIGERLIEPRTFAHRDGCRPVGGEAAPERKVERKKLMQ